MDQKEVPPIGRGCNGQDDQVQLLQNIHLRDHRNSKPLGYQAGNDLILLCLPGYLGADAQASNSSSTTARRPESREKQTMG